MYLKTPLISDVYIICFCIYFAGSQLPLVDRSFIYVIVDLAKNNLRQTEYKVSNLSAEDSWVRLKRGKGKTGIDFRVLRKVYFPPDRSEKTGKSDKTDKSDKTAETAKAETSGNGSKGLPPVVETTEQSQE